MGHIAELYAAPDYLDQRHGGLNVPNKGNEGTTASEGVGRYGGGMTGSSWADESHYPNDPANPRNGPTAAISTDRKLETGGGYRSPGAPGHIDQLGNLHRSNAINPDGNQVAAADPNANMTRPYAAEDWDKAYNGYLRGRADLTQPPLDKITWVTQEERIHNIAGESNNYAADSGGSDAPDLTGWDNLAEKHPSIKGQMGLFADIDVRSEDERNAEKKAE